MNSRQLRSALQKSLLDNTTYVEVFQDCPNTVVRVDIIYRDVPYSAYGFAKVQWPDRWDADYGVKMAVRKAIGKVIRAILRDQPLHESITTMDPNHVRALFAADES